MTLAFHERITSRVRGAVKQGKIVDNFAGAGGASLGIEAAMGRAVDHAINHSELMLSMHAVNHPNTRHHCEDVWHAVPREVVGDCPVDLAWFSPDCKHHSKAKGGVPLEKKIRGLAWVALRWAIDVRPRVIIIENVEEFQKWGPLIQKRDAAGRPVFVKDAKTGKRKPHMIADPKRVGEYFRAFVGALSSGMMPALALVDELQEFWHGAAPLFRLMKGCGYKVEFRELVAADYGVPTTRKRFFLIARSDGLDIQWPQRTHAPRAVARKMGLKPWRAAAECIDWLLPCPSIFERKRPLAEATLRRIARGIVRYVIEAQEPFIVTCNHGGPGGLRSAADAMRTVTGSRDANGVVVPHVTKFRTGATGSDCGDPLHTITAGNSAADHPAGAAHAMGLVEAFLSKYHGERPGDKDGRASGPSEPIKTLDTQNRFGLVSATLMTNTTGHACSDLADPASTITSGGQQALVGATLIGAGGPSYSGKPTNAADPLGTVMTENHRAIAAAHMVRICQNGSNGGGARSAEAPVNTIVSKNEQCLVSASLVGVGGRAGQSPERSVEQPVATVTAKADAAIAAATLVKHYGTCRDGQPCTEPMPTITCGGNHVSEVRAFLVKYYSSGSRDQSLKAPMHTLTAKARMGLVTVQGQEYQIADIGLRMLQPHELLRAQFGRFASEYKLVGSKADQVMAIGNSVPPELAEAIVRANFPTECERSN